MAWIDGGTYVHPKQVDPTGELPSTQERIAEYGNGFDVGYVVGKKAIGTDGSWAWADPPTPYQIGYADGYREGIAAR